jgi:hypothetical protein
MKSKIIFFSFFSFLFAALCHSMEAIDDNRPAAVKKLIKEAYTKVASFESSKEKSANWIYNGVPLYKLCSVNEQLLLMKLIQENPEQKEFYVLDVGAGDYIWVDSFANFINEQRKNGFIKDDIVFHIAGVGGEKFTNVEKQIYTGIWTYKYGQFKIEEINEGIKETALDNKKFDIIISRMTLRHLIDPAGSFIRIYNLLGQNRFFLFDKFHFLYEDETINKYNDLVPLEHMISFLKSLSIPFLFSNWCSKCTLFSQGFIVKKPKDQDEVKLPWSYHPHEHVNSHSQFNSASGVLIRFNAPADQRLDNKSIDDKANSEIIYGDQSLYDDLNKTWYLNRDSTIAPAYKSILWKK